MADEADFLSLVSSKKLSIQNILHRAAGANQAGQTLGATCAGNNGGYGFRLPDGIIAARHEAKIAGERQFATAAHGIAVDGGDDRRAHGLQMVKDSVDAVYIRQSFRRAAG